MIDLAGCGLRNDRCLLSRVAALGRKQKSSGRLLPATSRRRLYISICREAVVDEAAGRPGPRPAAVGVAANRAARDRSAGPAGTGLRIRSAHRLRVGHPGAPLRRRTGATCACRSQPCRIPPTCSCHCCQQAMANAPTSRLPREVARGRTRSHEVDVRPRPTDPKQLRLVQLKFLSLHADVPEWRRQRESRMLIWSRIQIRC